MTTDNARIPKSSSWPRRTRTAVRRWLSLKSNAEPSFHSDCTGDRSGVGRGGQEQGRRKSCSDRDRDGSRRGPSGAAAAAAAGWLVEEGRENLMPPHPRYGRSSSWRPPKELRVLVGTWNVGGRSPHQGLDLSGWLLDQHDQHASSSPHIYVLGFQEIVPLNAGNVLGSEDRGPASKWLGLIGEALNPSSLDERNDCHRSYRCATVEDANPESGHKAKATFLEIPVMDDTVSEPEEEDEDEDSEPSTSNPESSSEEETGEFATMMRERARHGYRLAASKQMVGIFLCVWVQADVMPRVTSLRVSCVGRGIMGYMGNKGSISISLTLQGGSEAAASTSLCFVCTHLASGEKDGDEVRRNSDVAEILKSTQFPRICKVPGQRIPEKIIDHDRIIWLGDLNYRVALTYDETRALLEQNDWDTLLENDQLMIERQAGRVFKGWKEGKIYFAPTYKYKLNSDTYAGETTKSKRKRRTPSWCDRILWHGKGIEQLQYIRGEHRFSDHRPVCSVFVVEADVDNGSRIRKGYSTLDSRIHCESPLPIPQRHSFYDF